MLITLVLTALLTINTLSAEFERKLVTADSKETLKGIIYYHPQKAVIEVNDPVHQIMTFSGNIMTIFYPEEGKAFRIKAKNLISIPFVQGFVQVIKEDYGLGELGYKLTRHETRGDTLYTHWSPPPKQKKILGMFTLVMVKEKLVYAEAQTPDGEPAVRSSYRNYAELNGKSFPLEIYSEIYSKSGLSTESVTYSDVQFNLPLPERILNFTIPDSVSVKEIQW